MQTTGFAQIILSSVDQGMLTLTEYYTWEDIVSK